MLVDFKQELMHDTALPVFRMPMGAVKTEESVAIRLKSRYTDILSIHLVLFKEGYESLHIMQNDGLFWHTVLQAPETPNVYWYYFCIHTTERVLYYGAEAGKTCGMGSVYSDRPPAFQFTVYDAAYDTPAWFKKSIMYQIFPDRFKRTGTEKVKKGIAYHKQKGRKVYFHDNWNEPPCYKPQKGEEHYSPTDYFGGTVKGIEDSLPYFKKLGISVLYLNPVFEAASNHRYNTADYLNIDPILGTNDDFRSLCTSAQKYGIRIILDGVFSHTGSDSIYFNREGAYESKGAYNSKESSYYSWYSFEDYPDKYKAWWGFKTLPEVNEHDGSWQDFMLNGDHSVLKHWIAEGASGYRLDVADELPDDVIALMRKAVKEKDRDAVVIGEVWEDATTKYSYGKKRKFALGLELDSVTNYPFRNSVVNFLNKSTNAFELRDFFISQALNYPKPMYYALMNLLSSHDIERIRTALSVKLNPYEMSREQQSMFTVNAAQDQKGALLQRLAVLIQMSVPGVPCVYYGDETGMQGFLDPFNREPFHKGKFDLTPEYEKLCGIRSRTDALKTGSAAFLAPNADCIGILRYITEGKDVFGEAAQDGIYFTAINRSETAQTVVFDFLGNHPMIGDEDKKTFKNSMFPIANCLTDDQSFEVSDALLEITMQPYGYVLLKLA